jgi:mannosyltransferase
MRMYGNRITTSLLAVIMLAISIRLAGINSRAIWYDEAFSMLFSEQGLGAMIDGTLSQTGADSAEEHPLGYYTVLWAWRRIFGQSIAAARLLSICINLITIALAHQIGLILFNKKTAIIAALLMSILPFQIHFAQEIRMYALLSMWLLLATLSFLRARTGSWKWWIVFAVASALAQYTHNLAAIYLVPLALTPLIQRDWKTLRSLILAGAVSILLYLPWLIHLPSQLSKVSTHYWVEQPGVEKIFTLILFYLPHLPLPDAMLLPGLLFAALTVALGGFQTFLAWKNKYTGAHRGIWLAYLAFMPPLLLWSISQFVPVYIERGLLPSHAVFCIWLAWVLVETKLPRLIQSMMAFFIIASASMGIYQHVTYKGFPYAPYSELSTSIQNRLEPGDMVIHSTKLSYLPMLYYVPALPQGYIIDLPGSNVDTLAPATREILNVREFKSIEQASINVPRVLLIIYQNSIEEFTAQGYDNHPHIEYMDKNFLLESVEIMDDIRLYLYTPRP